MTYEQAMAALKSAGSEQTRRTYARHGVDPASAFGVSYAFIYKLAKEAGTDQLLAEKLWASGNHDARILATNIAEPEKIPAAVLEDWMKQSESHLLMDAVSTLAMRTPHAATKARAWIDSKHELVSAAGWNMVGGLAMAGAPEGTHGRVAKPDRDAGWDDADFEKLLARIEREIHTARNRVKHSMNNALISIGLRGGRARNAAVAAAKHIGKVHVDHGNTDCKTPDAIEYIKKVEARRKPASARPAAEPASHAAKPSRGAKSTRPGRKLASARRG